GFLQIGALAMSGLALPDLFRAEARSGIRSSHKSIIMVFLPGGPPHIDMFDLKPDAPEEVRGEFRPIRTNVPGIDICELMPRLAAQMHNVALIRSIVETPHDHAAFHCLTGRPRDMQAAPGPQPAGGWPALGSVLSKRYGPVDSGVPPFVSL